LPTTRGSYIIGKFNAYQDINLDYSKIEVKKVSFPNWIEGVNPYDLYSESSVINCAYVSGIIDDVMEDECIYPVISGRMGTPDFDFKIKHSENDTLKDIKVSKSQCEIDGGYEGIEKVAIIEAKNSVSDDFLIRQLYYPYRLWKDKLTKELTPIFLIYSNDTFSFFIYEFEDPSVYNSLRLIKQKHYVIEDEDITLSEIKEILSRVRMKSEPDDAPFPQANSFHRVLDLLFALQKEDLSIEDITLMQDFDKRQADYYSSAGRYLGVMESKGRGKGITLSDLGNKIISQKKKRRNLLLVECILQYRVFNDALKLYLQNYRPVTKNEAYQLMKKHNIQLGDRTLKRRAGTVVRWIDWIMDLQG
jgi:hypothetical protein